MCKHPIESLIGTAEGITCRACGEQFKSLWEVYPKEEPEKPAKKVKKKKEAAE